MKLTAEQAIGFIQYDPATGVFTRKKTTSHNARCGEVAGCPNSSGYMRISVLGKSYRAHRLAWLIMTGEWPEQEIDHINGVTDDNRWCNLRAVSHKENGRNQASPKDNASGVIGVSWHKQTRKWMALICVGGRRIYLGVFPDIEKAASARKEAEKKHGFHENHGRPSC